MNTAHTGTAAPLEPQRPASEAPLGQDALDARLAHLFRHAVPEDAAHPLLRLLRLYRAAAPKQDLADD